MNTAIQIQYNNIVHVTLACSQNNFQTYVQFHFYTTFMETIHYRILQSGS